MFDLEIKDWILLTEYPVLFLWDKVCIPGAAVRLECGVSKSGLKWEIRGFGDMKNLNAGVFVKEGLTGSDAISWYNDNVTEDGRYERVLDNGMVLHAGDTDPVSGFYIRGTELDQQIRRDETAKEWEDAGVDLSFLD